MTAWYTIRVSEEDGVAQVHLAGEVDLAARSEIRAQVRDQLDSAAIGTVVVDLSGVAFLDSSGLGTLIGCKRMADLAAKSLRVTGARGRVAKTLELTGIGPLLAGTDTDG